MKREEAIEQLRNLKKANFYSSTIIALDMAIEALQADAAQKLRDVPRYFNGIKVNQIKKIPSEAEQVTGKLNNPDDSLLTADSDACKEQKSKLDLISRQAALAEFRDGRDVYDIMESIDALPSVPDSRQRGEWVYGIDDETGEKDCYPWTCSVCNKEYPWQPNYCPNCGADMRGEEE